MTQALIIDPHTLWRSALRNELTQLGYQSILETSSPSEGIACLKTFTPTLIILDIDFQDNDGIETIYHLRTMLCPKTHIGVFTFLPAKQFALKSLQAGANLFISKAHANNSITPAIQALGNGYCVLPQPCVDTLIEHTDKMRPLSQRNLQRLSPREFSVLSLLLDGHNNLKIAEALGLNPKTVSTYKHRILTKIGTLNLAELRYLDLKKYNQRTIHDQEPFFFTR